MKSTLKEKRFAEKDHSFNVANPSVIWSLKLNLIKYQPTRKKQLLVFDWVGLLMFFVTSVVFQLYHNLDLIEKESLNCFNEFLALDIFLQTLTLEVGHRAQNHVSHI